MIHCFIKYFQNQLKVCNICGIRCLINKSVKSPLYESFILNCGWFKIIKYAICPCISKFTLKRVSVSLGHSLKNHHSQFYAHQLSFVQLMKRSLYNQHVYNINTRSLYNQNFTYYFYSRQFDECPLFMFTITCKKLSFLFFSRFEVSVNELQVLCIQIIDEPLLSCELLYSEHIAVFYTVTTK